MDRPFRLLDFPERLVGWQRLLPYALLLSVTFALYGASLYFHFVWDDFHYIAQNYRIHGFSPEHLRAIWTHTYLGHYAPLHNTFLAALYSLSDLEPFGYHLGQLLLHALCVCLLYGILKEMESARVALLASLLFAVYPANIETVAWISETKSTLAFFFFLLSLGAFLRLRNGRQGWHGIVCGLFLVLSLLSKVNTIVAPVIFFLHDYKQGSPFKRGQRASLVSFFGISAVFAVIHLAGFYGQGQSSEGIEYYGGGLRVHLQNIPLLIAFYLRMAIFPHPLSAWQMMPIYEEFHWVLGIGWAGLLAGAWLLYRSNRLIQFWALWFIAFLLPVLQIFPFPIWVADRYLYVPAVGAFVLGSRLFFWVGDRVAPFWRRMAWELALGTVLLAFAGHTRNHLPAWENDLTLWEATTPTCMTSAFCHLNFGLALLQQGQTERGLNELLYSVKLRPAPLNLTRLGDIYTGLRDYRQAVMAYQMALDAAGQEIGAEFYAKLARAHLRAGNLPEASRAIEAGAKINPNEPTLLLAEGFLKWKQQNFEDARHSLRRALALTGQTSQSAGWIYRQWGDAAEVGRLISALGPL